MALDDLIKRRRSVRQKVNDESARAYAKGAAAAFPSGKHTASETGARALAERRANFMKGGPGIKDYANASGSRLTPMGATPQFKAPSQSDIEDMIQPKKKGG